MNRIQKQNKVIIIYICSGILSGYKKARAIKKINREANIQWTLFSPHSPGENRERLLCSISGWLTENCPHVNLTNNRFVFLSPYFLEDQKYKFVIWELFYIRHVKLFESNSLKMSYVLADKNTKVTSRTKKRSRSININFLCWNDKNLSGGRFYVYEGSETIAKYWNSNILVSEDFFVVVCLFFD